MPDLDTRFTTERSLPDDLPESPWDIFREWWDDAHALAKNEPSLRNPNAMTLCTVDADNRPSARVVLIKGMDLSDAPDAGRFVFYSNRYSRKGRQLDRNQWVAATIHWDALDLQVRLEGPALPSPDAESDAYFQSRTLEKKLGAWGSRQSEPLESRDQLIEQVAMAALELGVQLDDEHADIPRPPHWGGYRLWCASVELWCAGVGRVHDRARWSRELQPATVQGVPGYQANSTWAASRLNP